MSVQQGCCNLCVCALCACVLEHLCEQCALVHPGTLATDAFVHLAHCEHVHLMRACMPVVVCVRASHVCAFSVRVSTSALLESACLRALSVCACVSARSVVT
eukprot:9472312-Alexandrium_andersonii.AAC.1